MASKKSLEAAAATAGLFKQASPNETKQARQQAKTKAKKDTRKVYVIEEPREKATFSVKIDSEVLKKWRIYTSMNGYGDKGKLTEAAISEYMNRHKLTPEQQARFIVLCEVSK